MKTKRTEPTERQIKREARRLARLWRSKAGFEYLGKEYAEHRVAAWDAVARDVLRKRAKAGRK